MDGVCPTMNSICDWVDWPPPVQADRVLSSDRNTISDINVLVDEVYVDLATT